MKSMTWLDLRLMLIRQPAIAVLLGITIILIGLLLSRPSEEQPGAMEAQVDPARVLAALRTFRGLLITPAGLSSAQKAILTAAAEHRLVTGQVDYAQENDPDGNYVVASMRLPVTGRYTDIRGFIEDVLSAQPALSIRHLSIQREAAESPGLSLNATLTVQILVGESAR